MKNIKPEIWSIFIPLFILLAVGSFMRLYNLDHIILNRDEPLHQVKVSYQPFPYVIAYNNGSAFFSLLVHFLLPLGKIEFMARLASAVFGVLAMVMVYLLGKTFFSKKEGLVAAAFLAFSWFHIFYSQTSRAYATFTLFSLLSLYFFYRAVKENKKQFWLLFSLLTTLSIYNHLVALLVLPSYALYLGFLWIKGLKKGKSPLRKNPENSKLKQFVLWTFIALILVSVLYQPTGYVQEFLSGSAQRAKTQPADISISILLINDILKFQVSPQTPVFYFMTLALMAIGIGTCLKKYYKEILLSLLYILLPYLIFVAIKPREANVLSADRYFIFILPLVFLLTAKGIVSLSLLLSSFLSSFKSASPDRLATRIRKTTLGVLVLIMVLGYGSNFKEYYLDSWRLGSLRLDKEVASFLRKNVKRDGLIYFDFFPASSLITVINPLDKSLKPEETDFIIRENFAIIKPESDFMVYRIENLIFTEFVSSRNADLWVVTQLDSEENGRFLAALKTISGVKASRLKDYTILLFEKPDESLIQKLAKMTDLFLSLRLERPQEKQFHLLAAKAYLMARETEDGYMQLQAFREINLAPEEAKIKDSPRSFQVFDRIFGLTPQKLQELSSSRILSEIQRLLYLHGNQFLNRGELERASRAYFECLNLSKDFDLKVTDKLVLLAKIFEEQGNQEKSLLLCQKALELNSQRYDLRFLLAEVYRKEENLTSAEEEYKKAFGLASLPDHFLQHIEHEPPAIIIWEKDSIWHLLFQAEEDSVFSGSITGSRKINKLQRTCLQRKDTLRASENRVQFQIKISPTQMKSFTFRSPKKSRLTFDLKINGIRNPRKIYLLPRGLQLSKIPFSNF